MAERWQRCRDCRAGADAIKAGGTKYLPRPSAMTKPADYSAYVARAVFFNALDRTIAALGGAALHRPPSVTVPERIQPDLADLTLHDEPVEMIARQLVHEVLTVGRAGILLDMASAPGGRPYWVTFRAEDVVNWRSGPIGADPDQLTLVILRTSEPDDDADPYELRSRETYRELAIVDGRYQVRVWTKPDHRTGGNDRWQPGEWMVPVRMGQPLPFIPFTFIGPAGTTADVERPPLLDLAEVNLSHYRSSADREHALHLVALPTPWVSGAGKDTQLAIGPSVAWVLEKDGKAGMLEFSGQGVGAIKDAMLEKQQLMAMLGARLLDETPRVQETATAIRMRHSGEAAALRTIADAVSAAMTKVLRWHTWWSIGTGRLPLDVRVDLSDEFFQVRADPQEIQAALLAVQAGAMSFDTFYGVLERAGWARPGVSAAEERHAIDSTDSLGTSDNDDLDLDPEPMTQE
jgi:hypothetical protein